MQQSVCASIMDCISRINNAQINHAKDLDVVMPMYNLIEYSDNYLNRVAILQRLASCFNNKF